ncbi:nitroimidazol reductase NimA-like FMN-containing flavoprotein (pyridoxamine 5'-phosphate oxidase superfamily) [Microbacterium halimionae]|uniref:Nitroimidazol reductase NimA-like FMN-containing flavoprotein (Pyridoxamine 5'-phosphate oxidase superfamily) n=1 Tax=Microbacterium halimionae TaxID=1526413 RepID=A0A7W3JMF5_9MICO|nr:pyridoxamine 5'-phosphate oxidase family protein [Microbacterium halimionae]MBA8815498.1 nitroimidazol reductase NimA-like FMN-containing flavoprotein (pyridoxamine 5'-phosphate oxidase superfamily) [Microbacterium halimionae]NII95545.1 nitroimidazol reductase NimA-like FMN-containing flavoprotein (pyridoxamine 5'-phosphate oxidase superfamily) [Microbacterium halimionae]
MSHDVSEPGWSPQGPVVELSDEESWKRLSSKNFGHLALSTRGRPDIFPVNYYSDGRTILFRSSKGAKLNELVENPHVAFEVDADTPDNVWSVVVHATAKVLKDDLVLSVAARETLPAWIPVEEFVYVSLEPNSIRGRLFERHLPIGRI